MITLATGRILVAGFIGRRILAMQSTTPHPTKAKTQAGGVGPHGIFAMDDEHRMTWQPRGWKNVSLVGIVRFADVDLAG
jgi:hypothetical protein